MAKMKKSNLKSIPSVGRQVVQITEAEKAQLAEFDKKAVELKVAFANSILEFAQRSAPGVQQNANAYMSAVKEIARAHQIDVDDPSKGKWNFDAVNGEFQRV